MAKDDYHVIVYKILAYLYSCLKKGENPEKEYLLCDGALFNIHHDYWLYIIENLVSAEYIKGITEIKVGNGYYIKNQLSACQITPKGIHYLKGDEYMGKVLEYIKENMTTDLIANFI